MHKNYYSMLALLSLSGCGLYQQPVPASKHELETNDMFEKTDNDLIKNIRKIMQRLIDINKELSCCSADDVSIKITAEKLFTGYDEYTKDTHHKSADNDLFIKSMINKQLDAYTEGVNDSFDLINGLILEHKNLVRSTKNYRVFLGKKPLHYASLITFDKQQLLDKIEQVRKWAQEFKALLQTSYIAPKTPRLVRLKAFDLNKKEDLEAIGPVLRVVQRLLIESQETSKKRTLRALAKHQEQYNFAETGLKLTEMYQSKKIEVSLILKTHEDIIHCDPFGRADVFVNVYDAIFDDHDVSVLKEFFTSLTGEKFLSQANKLNTHFQNFTSKTDAALKNCKDDSTKASAILLQKIKQLVSILYNEKMAAVYTQTFIGLGSEAKRDLTEFKKRVAQFIASDTFHSLIIDEFAGSFTDKDLDILLQFFESSTGEKYLNHQAEIAKATLEMMLSFVYDTIENISAMKQASSNQKSCDQEKIEPLKADTIRSKNGAIA